MAPVPGWLVDRLMSREPLFDRPEVIHDEASFDREVADDFLEIGASGACYLRAEVREVVLGRLAGTHPTSLPGGYRIEDAAVRELAHRRRGRRHPGVVLSTGMTGSRSNARNTAGSANTTFRAMPSGVTVRTCSVCRANAPIPSGQ
jgi:hypothetical protein